MMSKFFSNSGGKVTPTLVIPVPFSPMLSYCFSVIKFLCIMVLLLSKKVLPRIEANAEENIFQRNGCRVDRSFQCALGNTHCHAGTTGLRLVWASRVL